MDGMPMAMAHELAAVEKGSNIGALSSNRRERVSSGIGRVRWNVDGVSIR